MDDRDLTASLGNVPRPRRTVGCQDLLASEEYTRAGFLRKKHKVSMSKMAKYKVFNRLQKFTWLQKYVVLSGGCLYIYRNESSTSPASSYALYGYNMITQATDIPSSEATWAMKLVHATEDRSTKYFSAASEQEKKKWMVAFKKEMLRANNMSKQLSVDDFEEGLTYDDIEESVYGTFDHEEMKRKVKQVKQDESNSESEEDDDEDYEPPPDQVSKPPSRAPPPLPIALQQKSKSLDKQDPVRPPRKEKRGSEGDVVPPGSAGNKLPWKVPQKTMGFTTKSLPPGRKPPSGDPDMPPEAAPGLPSLVRKDDPPAKPAPPAAGRGRKPAPPPKKPGFGGDPSSPTAGNSPLTDDLKAKLGLRNTANGGIPALPKKLPPGARSMFPLESSQVTPSPTSPESSSPHWKGNRGLPPEPVAEDDDEVYGDGGSEIDMAFWEGPKEKCKTVLEGIGQDGIYLLRRSDRDPDQNVLMVYVETGVKLYKVQKDPDGHVKINNANTFVDLGSLIQFYRNTPISGTQTKLTMPYKTVHHL